MKLTKKAASLLLAASLAVSVCAMPVFATGTTHVAENSKDSATNTTTEVKYKVTEGYTWAIPATIDFGSNAGVKKTRTVDANQVKDTGSYKVADTGVRGESGNVYVSDCKLKPGEKLTISISNTTTDYESGEGKGFFVKTTNTTTTKSAQVYYDIYLGTITTPGTSDVKRDTSTNSEILTLDAGKDKDTKNLTFILTTGDAEIAGDYTGKVAFEAKVDNVTT